MREAIKLMVDERCFETAKAIGNIELLADFKPLARAD